jgi:hypothetical protein
MMEVTCPKALEIDFLHALPMTGRSAKVAVDHFNLNRVFVPSIALIGKYCYCILLALATYHFIKFNYNLLKNLFFLSMTILLILLILSISTLVPHNEKGYSFT